MIAVPRSRFSPFYQAVYQIVVLSGFAVARPAIGTAGTGKWATTSVVKSSSSTPP
jgi:hypothetical protein